MSKTLELRKYPNRRLYNPELNKYITVADVESYVRGGITVRVHDKVSGDDITVEIFMQIISANQRTDCRLDADALADVIKNGPFAILDPRLATEMRERKITYRDLFELVCAQPKAAA